MKDDRLYVIHICECIQNIKDYTSGGRSAFLASRMIQDAVIRNFEVMGEAAKHLSEALKARHGELPWKQIAGFRDVLIHDYIGVDVEAVWAVVENDLPLLEARILSIRESL